MARLSLHAGARVLDIGCGCGQTLLQLADLVGPSGHVLGADVSVPMLARARERVVDHPEIALVCGDAQTEVFPRAAFDALFSRFGVMFFEDARAAIANLRGALRPGGQLAFVCWQARHLNPWAELPLQAVLARLPGAPLPAMFRPGVPGPFAFAEPAYVHHLLTAAGFVDVSIEASMTSLQVGGALTLAEGVSYCRKIGPAARAISEAPPELHPQLETALAEALAPFVTSRGLWMDAATLIVSARNPAVS